VSNNHGVIRDERGQDEPKDKDRAQQTSSRRERGQADPPLQTDDDVTSTTRPRGAVTRYGNKKRRKGNR
jgi:hypothetical protein